MYMYNAYLHIHGESIGFQTFFVQSFEIVVDS